MHKRGFFFGCVLATMLAHTTIDVHTHKTNDKELSWMTHHVQTICSKYNSPTNIKNPSPKQEMEYKQNNVPQWNLYKNTKTYNNKLVCSITFDETHTQFTLQLVPN
jgi:hypothetical protein